MECEFRQNEDLSNYSTMKIGGKVDYLFLPKNFRQVLEVIDFAKSKHLSFAILGNGSNTLCSSFGFKGVVICTKFMKDYEFLYFKYKKHLNNEYNVKLFCRYFARNNNYENRKTILDKKNFLSFQLNSKALIKQSLLIVRCYSGMSLPLLCNLVSQKSFSGLEFACSIPATIGGAVKMNAGAFDGQMSDIVFRVLVYNFRKISEKKSVLLMRA